MRYYSCAINMNSDKIKESAKVRLKDYDYDSPIAAVNKYVRQNIISNVQFFLYREEGSMIRGAFSYREDRVSYKDAVTAISDLLDTIAGIRLVDVELEDISTYQYIENLLEGKRHAYCHTYDYLNDINEFLYERVIHPIDHDHTSFCLEEKMLSLKSKPHKYMHDKSLLDELETIREHSNKVGFDGNMVHYAVASKSMDAAIDMAETLLHNLMKAHRISSRRIEIVREIGPIMYRHSDNFERVIKSNFGGAVIIDMTERMGDNPIDYELNCKQIANLVKKYKNDCLFIFTYNIDHPGFAYTLMPMLLKHVSMVRIKEATGSKTEATRYLQELIKGSQYSQYAKQASEFLKTYRGDKFSQTDMLEAYEKFEPWCVNHNFFNAYSYNQEEEFWLDRDDDTETSSEKLEKMIGLHSVKEQIDKILVANMLERERKQRKDNVQQSSSMHMIFGGNPGSAKTTVAKLFAGIAKEKGLLKSGAFLERGGTDYNVLGGCYRLMRDFEAAKGGVLFIDEAYAIQFDNVITLLIKEMENRRDEVIVILAGYNERMKGFLELNEGLKSRIPYWVDFPDYSTEELLDIFQLMSDERGLTVTEDAKKEASLIFEKVRCLDNFGNGRYVRNFIEKAIQNQSVRLHEQYAEVESIPEDKLFTLTAEDIIASEEMAQKSREVGAAKAELDEMIGISSAKKIIHRAIASFKMNKVYADRGIRKDRPSMHMVFTGNPGTAKTTTARLVAEILRDEKVLPSGQFVEVGRADLIGRHVGETAPLVKKRFREAQGGVLFIDEAYSLCDNATNSFGDEAISTIVQEMENHREDVIVIFAGYPKEMKEFLERNPGMESRIAFHVDFEDYTTDELCEIAKLMLKKKDLRISSKAMLKLRDLCDEARARDDYGNGRFVRKILEEAEMNLAQRVSELDVSKQSDKLITTIEACDIEEPDEGKDSCIQIGFKAS